MVATDYLGNELKVGDVVIYTSLKYRDFTRAYVMKITPCMVFLSKDKNPDNSRWIKQGHNQVIKHE